MALNVEMASSKVRLWVACNRFVAHCNAFTSIAIVPNLVPWKYESHRKLLERHGGSLPGSLVDFFFYVISDVPSSSYAKYYSTKRKSEKMLRIHHLNLFHIRRSLHHIFRPSLHWRYPGDRAALEAVGVVHAHNLVTDSASLASIRIPPRLF